ncbi:hypothetical protein BWI17_18280 [Betaproteobacteria bacterium GR16-43]|nr:hypothetical protein BWI17_18280 [Betaproteobacteria bacterium GR16-43]
MASKKRSTKTKARAASGSAQMDVQVKEFQSAVTQLHEAMDRLGKIQICYECTCGPCNECTTCKLCTICQCKICKPCKICNTCFECTCGPCFK